MSYGAACGRPPDARPLIALGTRFLSSPSRFVPHLTLEYSGDHPAISRARDVLHRLHALIASVESFSLEDIKSRAVVHDVTLVGDGSTPTAFVHLTVAILDGRPLTLRQRIATECLALLRHAVAEADGATPCEVTVEIREMERASYAKARLA